MPQDINKLNFIQEELHDWAEYVEGRLEVALLKAKIENGTKSALLRSLSYKIFVASGGHQGKYQLSFITYGRMLDMGVGRKRKLESVNGNGDLIFRKAKKWYSKPFYKSLNNLIDRIAHGYQEEVIYNIKQPLQ